MRGTEGVSLSLMSEACLGKALDKSMQLSSWASRPLSQRQLTYAGEAYIYLQKLQLRGLPVALASTIQLPVTVALALCALYKSRTLSCGAVKVIS